MGTSGAGRAALSLPYGVSLTGAIVRLMPGAGDLPTLVLRSMSPAACWLALSRLPSPAAAGSGRSLVMTVKNPRRMCTPGGAGRRCSAGPTAK